ncbi:MAG: TetR/AcrR family transcriptional regulator; helix-turn-helix transcriptional regulator [Dehalococcoidia bacterium]|nr:TetR/AcrR family transcriptional regulator; helix-turn-helix transcriptional regulator [Dehalococcoidia bacterium]
MSESVKPRRRYVSPQRQAQARATRAAILEAARKLFTQRGFTATTIEAIADRAGVSPESVYASFGSKRAVIQALIDITIVGDDKHVPLLERAWVEQLRGEPDPRRRIAILAEHGALILDRITSLYDAWQGAATADREVAKSWERYKAQRYEGQRYLASLLGAGGAFRQGMTVDEAADVLFALGSPEVYRLMTVDRGHSPDEFARWYAATLVRLLLAEGAIASTGR